MSDPFDPYQKWLGISKRDQPPHQYRLLGIDLFESDPDTIENAANQRMAHVRTFQSGKHSALSQNLLNEIAAARVCLLNPQKKGAYDRQLMTRLAAQNAPPPAAPPAPAVGPPSPAAALPSGQPAGPGIDVWSGASGLRRRKLLWQVPVAFGIALVAVLVLAYVLISLNSSPLVTGRGDVKPETPRAVGPSGKEAAGAVPSQPGSRELARPPVDQSSGKEAADSADGPSAPNQQSTMGTEGLPDPIGSPGKATGGPADRVAEAMSRSRGMGRRNRQLGGSLADLARPEAESTDTGQAAGRPTEKASAPPANARSEARQRIRELHKREYEGARNPGEKRALAQKLFQEALGTSDDPAAFFVLLEETRDMAIQAGDGELTFQAIGRMDSAFLVDPLAMKRSAIDTFVAISRLPAQLEPLVMQSTALMEEAFTQDDYAVASQFGKTALAAARKAKAMPVVRRISERISRIETLAISYDALSGARKTLEEDAQESQANLQLGRYYCLSKGDWAKGLPMLRLGADPELAPLAEMELQEGTSLAEHVKLAEGWWDLAEEETGLAKDQLRQRAGHLYTRVASELQGLGKATAEKRLDQIYQDPAYALAFDGTSAYLDIRHWKYDGTHPLTVEAIVMPNAIGSIQQVVADLEIAGMGLGMGQDGLWRFLIRAGPRYLEAKSDAMAIINRWVHLAAVVDGAIVRLYVAGRLQSQYATIDAPYAASRLPLLIGANPGYAQPDEHFKGWIDEVRISNSAKYSANFRPDRRLSNDGDTVILLHFDEGAGSTAHDSSANNRHGAIHGARWVDLRRGGVGLVMDAGR